MFLRTTAINKILALKKRKKVIQGGSSAGKTFGIIPILIDLATKSPGLEISIVSESIPHLKKGALKDFIKIMKLTHRWHEQRYNATDRKYTFANDAFIEFFSPESILGARRNVLYINEANNISYEDYHQLAIRTSGDIYIDFNPAGEFWAHTEVLTEEDSDHLILTYEDNEALPANVIADFHQARIKALKESEKGISGYWTNWCKVYIDGEIGSLQGVVFNFELIDKIPSHAERVAYGLDWGFTSDPTALVDVWKAGKDLFLNEVIYQRGLTNADLVTLMKSLNVDTHDSIIADSAEPKSIEDLRRFGFSIRGANKGPDSVRHSINVLQEYTIYITRESTNFIKEARLYRWETGKDGKITGNPIDAYNHCWDAVRYVALNKLNKGYDNFDYQIG